jgi:predicted Ser/Thr protein kinase
VSEGQDGSDPTVPAQSTTADSAGVSPMEGGGEAGIAFRVVGPGATLGRYQVLEELGAGGMATVWRARDRELRREVAIKVLFPHLSRKADVVRRFQREARAAAGLEHPHILRVYDVGGAEAVGTPGGDPPYIVMELVRGQSLREVAEREGPMLGELVASVGAVLCEALAVAHGAGIVHRDVKPGNVMVATGGRLLLADFGVAHIEDDDSLVTRTGALLGTPSFMSPEQANGAALDGRSDVYSVGATLYQLATGSLPFVGSTARVVSMILRGELVSPLRRQPAMGTPLARAIEAMMASDPARRPASAAEAARRLRAIAADGGVGDVEAEVERFVADPAAYRARRTPEVVTGLRVRTEAALARHALPEAMALADRAAALAPDDAAVQALVARVAAGGRRRRWGAALLAAAGAAAIAGGVVVSGGGERAAAAVTDAAVTDAAVTDAAAVTVRETAAVTETAAETETATAAETETAAATVSGDGLGVGSGDGGVDAGALAVLPVDRGRRRNRADAGAPAVVPAEVEPAPPAAAAAAPADAGPRPPEMGRVVIAMDAWCDLEIDGTRHGRADRRTPIALWPGRHDIVCSQGPGLGEWRGSVDVVAGEEQTVSGTVLRPVAVRVAVEDGDSVFLAGAIVRQGATRKLAPGRYRVEVVRGGKMVTAAWVSLPRIAACELRDRPVLDCYRDSAP